MPTHAEQRALPYTQEQMFELVAAVDRYPEFLPWCQSARILRRDGNVIYADLVIGFNVFREGFTSKVTLSRPDRIDVAYLRGPLKYLNNHWKFLPGESEGCVVDFYVDFEFNSWMFQKLVGALFNEAVGRMIHSFEARAAKLYGAPDKGGLTGAVGKA